jgi:hypothetical protein
MLDNLDLNLSLDKEEYQSQIEVLMQQLRSLQKDCWDKKLIRRSSGLVRLQPLGRSVALCPMPYVPCPNQM